MEHNRQYPAALLLKSIIGTSLYSSYNCILLLNGTLVSSKHSKNLNIYGVIQKLCLNIKIKMDPFIL